ncbi:non-homologous end joining protein Ku [Streptomyces antimicrobicus]|uniref:Non-homologous end joining protein Ku n=1 Tax=Streptomyces antimicrobicus TaxID=2883108 RepID=A0ABS8AZK0_9ACTN|nr:Ku protein [Streptomyces antimicrobicus]MCB5177779.1 Ku protein [Streptomyces antimicrobicus]
MRSIWNGAISFGLVSIPIKLVNATENHSVSFRQIHLSDGGRVRYRKVCELDGEELSADEIGKGYEEADGSIIPITDADLATLPLPTAKTIEIVSFVPASEIDPLQMDAAYYLAANGVSAAKPYTLLREALKRSDRVAVAKFALRGRERLGMLRVVDDVIAMHGLLWPDEIRAPEGVAPETKVTIRDAELDLADALMATLGEVDMDSLHDDYREAVEAMIAAKSGEAIEPEMPSAAAGGGAQVIDLMAALEKSVRAAKASRGEGTEGTDGPEGTEVGQGGEAGEAEAAEAAEAVGGGREAREAEVTPIGRRGGRSGRKSAPAAPKAVGGKKSTASTARGAGGSSGGTSRKSTAAATRKSTSTAKTTAKSTAKSTAAKSASAKKSTAKTASKSAAKATSSRGTAAAGSTAKKAAPRKRTSA